MSAIDLNEILSKRVQDVEESPTFALGRKVAVIDEELKRENDYVVKFGIGQPDFNTPENIKDAGKKAIDDNKTKYTPSTGVKELKQAIVDKFSKENGIDYEINNIFAGNGAKQVLDCIMRAFVNPGEGVLIPVPYWVSYPQQVILSQGIPIEVGFNPDDLTLDISDLKTKIDSFSGRIKLLILNSPNNPSGAVYSKKQLEDIAEICLQENIYIIADEVYEKFLYGDEKHYSIASFGQELKDLTLTVNAVSKTYAMTGWRIGYCAAHKDIIAQMTKIQDQASSNPCSVSQWAAIEALSGDQKSVDLMGAEYKKRRDYIYDRLNNIEGIRCGLPKGAFYIFPDVSGLYQDKIKTSLDLADALLEKAKIAVVPGIAFGDDDYIRISYATSMKNIKKGMDRLQEFVKSL